MLKITASFITNKNKKTTVEPPRNSNCGGKRITVRVIGVDGKTQFAMLKIDSY